MSDVDAATSFKVDVGAFTLGDTAATTADVTADDDASAFLAAAEDDASAFLAAAEFIFGLSANLYRPTGAFAFAGEADAVDVELPETAGIATRSLE